VHCFGDLLGSPPPTHLGASGRGVGSLPSTPEGPYLGHRCRKVCIERRWDRAGQALFGVVSDVLGKVLEHWALVAIE
jgi:hypothetical protein